MAFQERENSFYTLRRVPTGKPGNQKFVYMHQEVIEMDNGMVVDYINHDGMDNRKANLRAASYSRNLCHRKNRSGAKHSKYKGIYWRKKNRKWKAMITFEKKRIHLGYFRNEIEAAKAYDRAARKYHKDFASLNFPD